MERKQFEMKEQETQPLTASAATMYRGMTARMSYLGQDRSEIQFAVKELGKEMSSPNQGSWLKLKRLLRYVKSNPIYSWLFSYQELERNVTVWSDGDFAGCIKSRKSNSAGVNRPWSHTIETWSTNQVVMALSSGEAEYCALVKSASLAIGIRELAKDLGVDHDGGTRPNTNANAETGMSGTCGVIECPLNMQS